MNWVKLLFLVGLIIMTTCPNTAEAVFGIVMDPCTIDKCTAACKAILKDKFISASCYHGTACLCFG